MKRLLVVEDDQFFREAMVGYLREKQFHVTEAANGKLAKDIFGLQQFDLVISDIQMPYLDGIELLKWVKMTRPTPMILLTGFTNLLDLKSAHDLGADEFLPKPFSNLDLAKMVKQVLTPAMENIPVVENQDHSFCRVSIEEFVSRSKIQFDVYVRLSSNKYVKIGAAGSDIPVERIRAYQKRGAQHLHIQREDFSKLIDFNLDLSKAVAKSDSISKEKKMNFMKYTGEVILEKAFVDGVDEAAFSDAREMLGTTVNVLTEGAEHLALLDVLNGHSDWVYAHSIGASMFALMIARKMGHSSSQTFFKLGMAGLFHEIGYKEISRELIDKPRPLLTQSERAIVETHVSRSREILSVIKGIPGDVIEIVYQHHEDMLGQGYPRRMPKERIHPLAKIFQAADIFADTAIKGPQHPGMPGLQALVHVENFHSDKIDREVLKALKAIFNQGTTVKTA